MMQVIHSSESVMSPALRLIERSIADVSFSDGAATRPGVTVFGDVNDAKVRAAAYTQIDTRNPNIIAGYLPVLQLFVPEMSSTDIERAYRHQRAGVLLSHLAVDTDYRGRGIGAQLLSCVEAHHRLRGCRLIYGQVAETEQASRRFYAHHRYVFVATPMQLPAEAGFGRLQPPEYHRAGQMFYKYL